MGMCQHHCLKPLIPYFALIVAVLASADTAVATREHADPAGVAGEWNYRTRSNCGSVVGVGNVSFVWNADAGTYTEQGHVYWADSNSTIRWWGTDQYDPQARRLFGRMSNTLGDTVDGHWQIEGPGPDRLVVRWNQTNGCFGEGVATRSGGG